MKAVHSCTHWRFEEWAFARASRSSAFWGSRCAPQINCSTKKRCVIYITFWKNSVQQIIHYTGVICNNIKKDNQRFAFPDVQDSDQPQHPPLSWEPLFLKMVVFSGSWESCKDVVGVSPFFLIPSHLSWERTYQEVFLSSSVYLSFLCFMASKISSFVAALKIKDKTFLLYLCSDCVH